MRTRISNIIKHEKSNYIYIYKDNILKIENILLAIIC
jgi:hypothetical protein